MKLIKSLVGVVVLSFVTSAFPQQEETASPAPKEKASATVQETPTPSPQTKTTKPTEQPAVQKKEKPAATAPQTAPSPAAAAPGKKMSAEATLKDNENRWSAAIAKHDTATIESMAAADFVGVSSKGKVQNRRAMLADVKGDKDTYTSAKAEKLAVHMYGSGVAVVVGISNQKGSGKDGKAFDRTYRFTDTWIDRGGSWQCVASQGTLVSQK